MIYSTREIVLDLNQEQVDLCISLGLETHLSEEQLLIDIDDSFCVEMFANAKYNKFQYDCFYSFDEQIGEDLKVIFTSYPALKELFEEDVIERLLEGEIEDNSFEMSVSEFHSYANPSLG